MREAMKAAVLTEKRTIQTQEVPRPQPTRGEVLVRVHFCGICGSDLHFFQQGLPEPAILGHEFSGEIAELGKAVQGWKVGEAVTAYPSIPCGSCTWCRKGQLQLCDVSISHGYGLGTRPGAMAEYIVVDASSLRRLPEGVGLKEAALAEPLGVVLHGVRSSRTRPGDSVVVIGRGTIGLLTILALSRSGVNLLHATDPIQAKRKRALELGANKAHDPEGLPPFFFSQIMGGVGPDIVFECVGIPQTLADAINYVRKGGKVLVLGVCMAPATLLPMLWNIKEVEIQGSYLMGEEYDMALEWLSNGKVPSDIILTKEVPLDEVQAVFKVLEGLNEEGKVQVRITD